MRYWSVALQYVVIDLLELRCFSIEAHFPFFNSIATRFSGPQENRSVVHQAPFQSRTRCFSFKISWCGKTQLDVLHPNETLCTQCVPRILETRTALTCHPSLPGLAQRLHNASDVLNFQQIATSLQLEIIVGQWTNDEFRPSRSCRQCTDLTSWLLNECEQVPCKFDCHEQIVRAVPNFQKCSSLSCFSLKGPWMANHADVHGKSGMAGDTHFMTCDSGQAGPRPHCHWYDPALHNPTTVY